MAWGQPNNWKSVQIKGGGFVSGIITHPNARGLIYARTDVGGAYRWNSTNNSWIPLLDFLAYANNEPTLMGVESLAIDPSDPNRLYLACADYPTPNAIFISTNQGATFARVTPPFAMHANNDGRSNGERLAVDPNLNSLLFYGSRDTGLYKSVNYGSSWSKVNSFPVNTTANGAGLVFVQFVQNSGTPGSATPVIFVGVSQPINNLYESTDGGVTWTNVPVGAPSTQMPHHAAQDGLGNMYLTYDDNCGPNNISVGSVWKLNLSTLASANVTPPTGQGGFAGVSVDLQNPTTLLVSTMDRWSPSPPGDQIYRSINGGASWKATLSGQPSTASAPWSVARNSHWAGDVEIDPFDSNHALFITGYGIIGCTNLTAADSNGTVNWAFNNDGLEELVPSAIASPSSGPSLLSVHGDIGGFRHYNLDVSPPVTDYFATHRVTSISIDFAELNPAVMVRTFAETPYGGYSLNNGTSWSDFSSRPSTTANGAGYVSVSANGSRMVWIPQNSIAYYSANNGASWTASTGGPTGSLVPIADRVNSSKFYIYANSRLYLSTDGGVSYTAETAFASGGFTPSAVFGFEGHVWVATTGGLWFTTNSGANFTRLSTVQQAGSVGFGKAAPGHSYPAIYINGQISSVWGIYRSDDQGSTWVRINDDQHQFGWIKQLTGDPRVYGRCYVAASGRGVLYGDLAQPQAPANLVAIAGDGLVNLSWSAASGATAYNLKRSLTSGGPYSSLAAGLTNTTYTDSGLLNGTNYYYVVSGTNSSGEGFNSAEAAATPSFVHLLTGGTIIGTSGSFGGLGHTKELAMDGDLTTYFDGPGPDGNWVGLDFGSGTNCVITQVSYCPRDFFGSRMTGGVFQGANQADFSDAVTWFTITGVPPTGTLTTQVISDTTAYRYVRYLAAAGTYGDVAEVQFTGHIAVPLIAPQMGVSLVAGQLQLSWPADHLGWQVQAQTNGPGTGLSTNWVTLPGSEATNWFSVPVDNANGSVFFRLISP